MFLPALERLQTPHPGAFTRGATSTDEGAETDTLNIKLSARSRPGAAGINSFLGGGDPSSTGPSSLVGASMDSLTITQKYWLVGGVPMEAP